MNEDEAVGLCGIDDMWWRLGRQMIAGSRKEKRSRVKSNVGILTLDVRKMWELSRIHGPNMKIKTKRRNG